jgi:hypothetical protein
VKSSKGTSAGPATKGASIAIPHATDPTKTVGTVKAKFFEGDEPTIDEKAPFRPVFAAWLTSPENKYFGRAAANRMWGHFFVRGLIDPIEDISPDNKPSHPELFEKLSAEFVASGFDLKHLIRCLCNSETYQRTSRPIAANKDDETLFSHQTVKVMDAEVLYDSLTRALGVRDLALDGGGSGTKPGGGGSRASFVRFFDTKQEGDPATESGHGVPQYLRLMNSSQMTRSTSVVEKLMKEKLGRDAALERMFLTVLSRRPTATEIQKMSSYLDKQSDTRQGYDDVMWVLLNSAEFMTIR